jgi:hypothetical protein
MSKVKCGMCPACFVVLSAIQTLLMVFMVRRVEKVA